MKLRIKEMEEKLFGTTDEIERLSRILREKDQEIEELKNKLFTIENEHSDVKKRGEKAKKAGRQEKQNLQGEVDRLNDLLNRSHDEIEGWRKRYGELENSMREYRGKFKNIQIYNNYLNILGYENKIREYEQKISILNKEIERLTISYKSKIEEVEQWKNKCYELEHKSGDLRILQQKMHDYENSISFLHKENDEWRKKNERLEITIIEIKGKLF